MVSNTSMGQTILTLSSLLLISSLCATAQSANDEAALIARVKTLLVSSLDRTLPNVTLEYFLNYEGAGAPIKWQVNECTSDARHGAVHKHNFRMCVEADLELKDRAAKVMVFAATSKKGPVDVPTLNSVSVTYPYGASNHLDRLSDLPAELHRPPPKGPKDLPTQSRDKSPA